LLKQVVPNFSCVAILSDEDIPRVDGRNPLEKANDTAARAAGVQPQWLKVKSPKPDLEGAFTTLKNERAEALLVLDVPVPIIHQKPPQRVLATRAMVSSTGFRSNFERLITPSTSLVAV
jgi:putative ABC transport system substrate-binding protein